MRIIPILREMIFYPSLVTLVLEKADKGNVFKEFDFMERLKFYKKSEEAYVIIQTGTTARYANIALQKGVI